MEKISFLLFAISLGMATFAWDSIHQRSASPGRYVAVVALIGWLLLLPFLGLYMLGWAKPMWGAFELSGKQRVLGSKLIEGEAIYLYLDLGRGEPRSYRLPWDQRMAERLQDALRESERRHRRGAIMEFDHSWDLRKPKFYPLPQMRLPMPKGPPPELPKRLERGA